MKIRVALFPSWEGFLVEEYQRRTVPAALPTHTLGALSAKTPPKAFGGLQEGTPFLRGRPLEGNHVSRSTGRATLFGYAANDCAFC